MKSNVAEKVETAAAEPAETARKPKLISPNSVTLDVGGNATRRWFVRAPEGLTADDLKEPEIWRGVQNDRNKALLAYDEIRIVAFDASWCAECFVASASGGAVTLQIDKVRRLESRHGSLYEDALYRVRFFGNGYAVERKKDLQRVTEIVANVQLAERHLAALYPRPAA